MTHMYASSLLSARRLGRGSTDLQPTRCVCIAGTKSGGLFNYGGMSNEKITDAGFPFYWEGGGGRE